MRLILQRVAKAWVTVENKKIAEINQGWLILFGVGKKDNEKNLAKLCQKISTLRAFSDDKGKMNLSIKDIKGEILVVSQFTLFGNCKKGNRPSFIEAAPPEQAIILYEKFIEELEKLQIKTASGIFAAYMQIGLIGDGPVTFTWDL